MSKLSNSSHLQYKVSSFRYTSRNTCPVQSTKIAATAELHDEKHQPDIKNGRSIGMPLDDFVEEAYDGLAAGKEEVAVQTAKQWYNVFEPQRQELFRKMVAMMGGK